MKRRVRGQSLVEMALVLPFLVFFTLGTMELGYYVYTYSELENATRRVSEAAAKTPPLDPNNANAASDECVKLAKTEGLRDVFLSELKPSQIVISYPGVKARLVGTAQIQVDVKYPIDSLTPIGKRFFRKPDGTPLEFSFSSRRTISSTLPPPDRNPDCSK